MKTVAAGTDITEGLILSEDLVYGSSVWYLERQGGCSEIRICKKKLSSLRIDLIGE